MPEGQKTMNSIPLQERQGAHYTDGKNKSQGKFMEPSLEAASKNSEFAQMPHKGTPIRYGQKLPVRNRQQGVEKILVLANLKVTLH